MRKVTSTYFAIVFGPGIARKLGEPSHISQVRLVGSFPSKAAFIRAAEAARALARTPQVDKSMLSEGSLVEHLEAETLYVCPVDAYGNRHCVRLDEYFPELRPAAAN